MHDAVKRHALVLQNLKLRQEGDGQFLGSEEPRSFLPHVRVLKEVLKVGLLQLGDLEDFDPEHRLEPLDHPTFVWDRIEQLDGIFRVRGWPPSRR